MTRAETCFGTVGINGCDRCSAYHDHCPRCLRAVPTGPWSEAPWRRLCAACKVAVTLSRPDAAGRLADARGASNVTINHDALEPERT